MEEFYKSCANVWMHAPALIITKKTKQMPGATAELSNELANRPYMRHPPHALQRKIYLHDSTQCTNYSGSEINSCFNANTKHTTHVNPGRITSVKASSRNIAEQPRNAKGTRKEANPLKHYPSVTLKFVRGNIKDSISFKRQHVNQCNR